MQEQTICGHFLTGCIEKQPVTSSVSVNCFPFIQILSIRYQEYIPEPEQIRIEKLIVITEIEEIHVMRFVTPEHVTLTNNYTPTHRPLGCFVPYEIHYIVIITRFC